MKESQTQQDKGAIGWLFKQVGNKKPALAFSIFTAIISSVCEVLPYFVIAEIVKKLLSGKRSLSDYYVDLILIAAFFLGEIVFHSISTLFSHGATFTILANIRKRTLDKLAKMPLGDVLMHQPGALKSTIIERIDSMETTLAHIVPEVSSGIIPPLILYISIFSISWKLGLAALATLPIGLICFMLMVTKNYEKNFNRAENATKNLNDVSVEYIEGIEVVKAFGKEKKSYDRFVAAAKELAASYVDWMKECNIFMTLAMAITPATMVAVLPIGAIMFLHGTISGLNLITVIVFSVAIIEPIIKVMGYQDDVANIKLIVGEVKKILDAPEMERPTELSESLAPKDFGIKMKNVHFGYQDKEVLHGINLEIPSGGFAALVGPSGSGKSTIAKLIDSLWEVKEGEIEIGGTDVRKIPLDYLADKIAYVSQDNYLFNKSVRDNIRMGKTNGTASDEEVEKVAKEAGCHNFIMSLENGYDTVVGSGGGHLSGGERQRIAIARAMLKNAEIIILDEATAYTDPENEAIIQESVAKLVKDKTLIVIAHRLSTVMNADRIFCIDNGQVVEEGTHEELLAKNGLYKKMWNSHIQVKDSDKEAAQ